MSRKQYAYNKSAARKRAAGTAAGEQGLGFDGKPIWQPQPGPQVMASLCPADITLFGGARGGGKTDCALGRQINGALKYGEAWNGLFLRKNFKHFAELRRRVDQLIAAGLPAQRTGGDGQTNRLKFSNGSMILFTAIEREDQLEFFQGQQFCVARGTKILMADGSAVCIEDLSPGDMIATMEGARRITRVMPPRVSPCVRVVTPYGEQMNPCNHPLFSSSGWQSFASILESDSRGVEQSSQGCGEPHVESVELALFRRAADQVDETAWMSTLSRISSSYGVRSLLKREGLLSIWSGLVRIAAGLQCSPHYCELSPSSLHDVFDEMISSTVRGFQSNNLPYSHLGDVLLRLGQEIFRDIPQEQAHAAGTSSHLPALLVDALERRGIDTLSCPASYQHPYTGEARPRLAEVSFETCSMAPCGEVEVFDLTVDGANHYIGHDSRLVNKNTEISIEEGCQFGFFDAMVEKLKGCMRSVTGVPCRMFVTANPGGPGHNLVKTMFRMGKGGVQPGTVIQPTGSKETLVFIPSRVEDNVILCTQDPKYVDRLRSIKDPKLRAAWLEGDWDVVAGGFFDDVWNTPTHVLPRFAIPDHWPRLIGLDWGTAKPFSVGWYAISGGEYLPEVGRRIPRGSLVRYREWYGCVKGTSNTGLRLNARDVAGKILSINDRLEYGIVDFDVIADPAIFKVDDGPSIADKMAEVGLVARRGDNRRVAGWDELRSRLVGDDGIPSFYVTSNCEHFIRTVPVLSRDENDWDDVDSDTEDHIADEVRYVLMSRPGYGVSREDVKTVATESEDDHREICEVNDGVIDLEASGDDEWAMKAVNA